MQFKQFIESLGDAPYFTYQGSKATIRDWVIQYMPKSGRWYVEPFGGRGNMFFLARKQLNFKKWYINDLNSSGFLNSLATADTSQLPDTMDQEKFDTYKADRNPIMEPEISHMGHYRTGYRGKYGKGRNWNYDKIKHASNIEQAKKSLEDVKITNLEWNQIPYNKYNREDFIYFDPPYLSTDNRYYKDIDHEAFLTMVAGLKARWMISMTNHPFYIERLGEPTAIKKRQARLNIFNKQSKNLEECIWQGNY